MCNITLDKIIDVKHFYYKKGIIFPLHFRFKMILFYIYRNWYKLSKLDENRVGYN